MRASTASVEVQNLVFSKWIEVKHKAEPHNYIEFFLVTDTGNEVLAISAEDHGNSHYVYQSTGAFAKYGALNSKNRADTISWLEMIIKESQIKVDSQLAEEMAHAGEPTPDNPLGLYYTNHRSEKTVNPDGTHTQRFFLLDQYGTWHLAVVGEERETRDGHYVYKATEEFAARHPLSCHAQKDVIHWLEQRVTHGLSQPPPLPSQQRRTGASGGASTAVSGAGAASEGSAEARGPTSTGMVYSSAATPTSAVDGMAGSDGAGPLLPQVRPVDLSLRQLTPPLPAVAPGGNQQQQPQAALPLPELLMQQPQLLPPQHQVQGLPMFPDAAAMSSGGQPQQQQQSGAAPVTALTGMQLTGEAAEGAGEPPPSMLPVSAHQALSNTPPAALAASPSSFLPNHAEMRPPQPGQHEAAGHVPQRQLSQNGAQEAHQHHHTQQQQEQQPVPRLFAGNTVHGTGMAMASAPAAGLASELPKLSFQQQLDMTAALPQRGMMPAVSTAVSQMQQEARPQTTSVTPPPPQLHFPMMLDPPLQLRQQLSQGQQGSQAGLQAEPQGLAQLLGLAGLAASMLPGGGIAPQLQSDMPPLPLQLPLPPQLQLQGSTGSQLTAPLQQQPPHLMLPNLFQQPQQTLLPLQQFNAQTQQELQLLQQQLQQQTQHLQQLLQNASGSLPPNSIGGPQQQTQGFLGGGGAQQLSHSSAALNALPGLPAGPQPWNAGGGSAPAAGGAPQQSVETHAVPRASGQAGMPHPLQLPGLLPGNLSAGMASTGLNALGTPASSLVGPLQGPPLGQPTDAGGAAASSDTALAHSCGGPSAAGGGTAAAAVTDRQGPDQVGASAACGSGNGCSMGAWPAGMMAPPGSFGNLFPPQLHPYPYPQQPQLQPFGQPGGVANTGAKMCGGPGAVGASLGASGAPALGLDSSGGSAALGFGGASMVAGPAGSTGAAAPPASPVTSLPGGFGEASASSGLAGSAAAAAGPLQQPLAGAGAQSVPLDMLLPAGRTREAGPGHHGGRGGAGGRGSGGKHKLAGVAEVAHKRKLARLAAAGEEAVRLAQGAYLASLRHQALSEAAQQEALRKTIASWVRGQISDDEVSVSGWHESLQQMLREGSRNRTVAVPFLSNDRLLELTRGSAEAITLAAALSLAAPYDAKGQPRTPGAPAAAAPPLPAVPVSLSCGGGAAAVMPPVGLASSCSREAEGCERGTGGSAAAAAALPGAGLPSSAEQMAALSSLKALLEGNLQAAVLGSTGANAAAGPGSGEPSQAGGSGNAVDSGGPTRMDVDGAAAGGGQSGQSAADQQADLHMTDAKASAAATSTPSAGAGLNVLGAAAGPLAAGLPSLQPPAAPQVPSLPPELPAATAPQPEQQQQSLFLPVVPQRPAGPASGAAVVACAGSAKSWAFADAHLNRHGVRIALESLREVAALCPPVADMASSNLVETVKQFESHPHPSVSGLAKEILKRWRGALIHRLRSMSDSRCYQDPVAALESKIQANEIVFPSINELLGGTRSGTGAPPADGATPFRSAPTPAGAVPYTPSGSALTSGGGAFAAYLAATPATAGEGQGLSCLGLPETPPLTLNAARTPALTTAGTTTTVPATITPAGGLSVACGAAPGLGRTTTTTAETPRGLFDAAAASCTNGTGSFPTPQLFSRPGGASGPLAPAVQSMQLSPQPAAPLFTPMSPPSTAAAASAAVAPSPQPPPAAVIGPPPAPNAATLVLPQPTAINMTPPAPAGTGLSATAAAGPVSAPSARAAAVAVPPTSIGDQLQQPHRLTSGKAPSLLRLPQTPSPAPPPPPAAPFRTASAAVAAAPLPAPAVEPMVVSPAAVLPMPSPVKLPAATHTPTAAALPPPSPAGPPTAEGPAAAVGTVTAAGLVVPAAPLPPAPQSGGTSGSAGPLAVPLFCSPLTFLPGSPSPPQATTAEVAALLAASAQTLAAHIQTAGAGGSGGGMGGVSAPPPPSFSPAQLNQLGALASTTKVYASALKSSDSAMAASAWQSLVQQLRQAQALSLGLGLGLGTCSHGGLPLFIPSPSPSALASGAPSASGQLPLQAAAWPSGNWAPSFQPLPTQLPLQIQPLRVQPMPSSPTPMPPPPSSTGHQKAINLAPQPLPADGGAAARKSLPSVSGAAAATATEPQVEAEAAPAAPPDARMQAASADRKLDAVAADADAPTTGAGTPPPPGGPTASAACQAEETRQPMMPPSLPATSADAAGGPHVALQDGAIKAVGCAGGECDAEGALEEGAAAALADGAGSVAAAALGVQQGGVIGRQQEHGGPGGSSSGAAGQDKGVENAPSVAGSPSVQGLRIPDVAEEPAQRDQAAGGDLAG